MLAGMFGMFGVVVKLNGDACADAAQCVVYGSKRGRVRRDAYRPCIYVCICIYHKCMPTENAGTRESSGARSRVYVFKHLSYAS